MYSWSQIFGVIIVGWFETVSEESDRPSFIFQDEELLRLLWIVNQKYLFFITTPKNYRNKILQSLHACVQLSLLLFEDIFYFLHTGKQTI